MCFAHSIFERVAAGMTAPDMRLPPLFREPHCDGRRQIRALARQCLQGRPRFNGVSQRPPYLPTYSVCLCKRYSEILSTYRMYYVTDYRHSQQNECHGWQKTSGYSVAKW